MPAVGALRDTERVAQHCTCGAALPEDARFCHKCGKPQFEPPAPEPESLDDRTEPARAPPAPLEISFHNRLAVRVGLLAAALSSLLTSLPMPMFLNILWLLVCLTGAGFFAVYLYTRRTGEELSARMGARMGWITGIFCFAIATVFFTITVIAISSKGGLASFYREQLSAQAASGLNVEEFVALLESPTGLASIVAFSILLLFVFFTLLPTLGGMMGAKVLEKE
mgnify:CR=1 FL=1